MKSTSLGECSFTSLLQEPEILDIVPVRNFYYSQFWLPSWILIEVKMYVLWMAEFSMLDYTPSCQGMHCIELMQFWLVLKLKMWKQPVGNHVLWVFCKCQTSCLIPASWFSWVIVLKRPFKVSPNKSREYLGFSMVTPPPPQRFPFERKNFKNILVRPFGMWVCMGNATNAIVLWPWPSISR